MPAFTFSMASGCDLQGKGYVDIRTLTGGADGATYSYQLTNAKGSVYAGGVLELELPLRLGPLENGSHRLRVTYTNVDDSGNSSYRDFVVNCTSQVPPPSRLVLDSFSATDETAAGDDGTGTIQASGGTPPLTASVVELSLTQPATSGQPSIFTGLPSSLGYTLRVTDSSSPTKQVVEAQIVIDEFTAPASGCQDEYATNYDPAATTGGAASCEYAVTWRSAWARGNMPVVVAAVPTDPSAYIVAELRIGFRPGHPLHDFRPLGEPIKLRATIGPDGYAVFRLGPLLRPALGTTDGLGGYRLDLNSSTATTSDLYVGYELRRAGSGELLEHGYALNAAVPDEQIADTGELLSPFAERIPVWPNFHFEQPLLGRTGIQYKYGQLTEREPGFGEYILLPCPSNPLPVAWLAPGGGFGYWVFQGKPQLGDEVGDGQTFTEATTGERRYSDRGETRRTVQASSGVFKGPDLMNGLRTLWASPQVWYKPELDGDWVPVTLSSGSFPAGRTGVLRQEVSVTFTEAQPQTVQGQ
jgi:hypothetical protein